MKRKRIENGHIPGDILFEVMEYADIPEIIHLSMTSQTAQKTYLDRIKNPRIEAMRTRLKEYFDLVWRKGYEENPDDYFPIPNYDVEMTIADAQQMFTCCEAHRFDLFEDMDNPDASDWEGAITIGVYRYVANFTRRRLKSREHFIKCKRCGKNFCGIDRQDLIFIDSGTIDIDGIDIRGHALSPGIECGNHKRKICRWCDEDATHTETILHPDRE